MKRKIDRIVNEKNTRKKRKKIEKEKAREENIRKRK